MFHQHCVLSTSSPMPTIVAVGTALPEHIIEQSDAREFVRGMFAESFRGDIDRLIGIFDNTEIERRHFCVPNEWFASDHTFAEKNNLYIENAITLSEQAIDACLDEAGMSHEEIDYLIFVSTTGLSTPSIDARLIARLPFRRDIKRVPLWGLGCAGGASSLARAMEIARANPGARILTVVVELCGLTFMRNDLTKSALIATSLFGDGAAATLVVGDEHPLPVGRALPRLLASRTSSMPDSLDVMGWDIGGDGFRVVISRDIPTIVRTFMRESIEALLLDEGLAMADIEHYVTHPGGAKVIEAYEESLGLEPAQLAHTRETLRDYGNMSACSVIFVLKRFIDELATSGNRGYGLLSALGPGFSSELVLVRWQ
jgi:alkylresorcinol/alkylpyrone synthase